MSTVSKRLAQYATRDEVTCLQEEIERLIVLVSTLGRQRMDRSSMNTQGKDSSDASVGTRTKPFELRLRR
eukprot:IDg19128t1